MVAIKHGGDWVAEALQAHGVRFVFTLTGGHIAPILVGAKQRGIRVIDTRHEATAVFAADAVARLTGIPGVAIVTAGPGVTNTITALKNAQMAQSPLVLIGGAAATALRGRGALQDIDQLTLLRSVVKWQRRITRASDLTNALAQAFHAARSGVPGPVFLEIPVDLLYGEAVVRSWYGVGGQRTEGASLRRGTLVSAIQRWIRNSYLGWHVNRLFAGMQRQQIVAVAPTATPNPDADEVQRTTEALLRAKRPVILVGSQALLNIPQIPQLIQALEQIGAPVYLSGMARGLLGAAHGLQLRHKRREALREADLVLLAGVSCDFRLDYGNHIPRHAIYIAANRSRADLYRNRRPQIAVLGDPATFLRLVGAAVHDQRSEHNDTNARELPATEADRVPGIAAQGSGIAGFSPPPNSPPSTPHWQEWHSTLHSRDAAREVEIAQQADQRTNQVNPLQLCRAIAAQAGPHALYVADGGDFVATASYILRPPGPLTWLDPGPFGTLGVGAGFALGAKLCQPEAEIWLLYGDGSAGYGLAEFDTFVRHGIGVIAIVGNDGGWTQIAREQVPMLGDDVGTALAQSDYERVAAAFGALGIHLDDPELVADSLEHARAAAASGQAVLVNALIAKGEFRKGSLSM